METGFESQVTLGRCRIEVKATRRTYISPWIVDWRISARCGLAWRTVDAGHASVHGEHPAVELAANKVNEFVAVTKEDA